ncbi:hypothetical protein Pst134EA_017193 [Puccinia striiformis f. sp. tritici]|uniref:hypothetical protein n=1 Tax=Puccinia striiformis f. sp. tritici TaxID=168172 RepID=UPI002008B4E4|nr:hypothetical protein Pst134EA_017193 [Puccinia striiformis f. sp. tritici]KAH9460882.1 hypothetical protein Pst134EA_017193 [Puccinia striiformis f. sp. tritici]
MEGSFVSNGAKAVENLGSTPHTTAVQGGPYTVEGKQIAKDGGLLVEILQGHGGIKAFLEGHPAISEPHLIAKDNSILHFQEVIDQSSAIAAQRQRLSQIHDENLQEHGNFQLLQLDWKDWLIDKFQDNVKAKRDDLASLDGPTSYTKGSLRSVLPLKCTYKQARRELELIPQGWWSKMIDFLCSLFRGNRWRQDTAGCQLNKLRRVLKASPPTRSNRKTLAAVIQLLISRRKGPNFLDRKLQLIEKMFRDSTRLTSDDEALVDKLATEKYVQYTIREITKMHTGL